MASGARSAGAREPERAPPAGEAAFPPAGRPPPDRDAAPQPGAGAREGPGAAAGGSSRPALAALEPRLALLLGARRLPGGLGEGPALLQPPAASLPGGEPHLVLYLELAGRGRREREAGRGGCLFTALCPGLSPSREEVARPGKLAACGCVAPLSFGGCFSVRAPVF